MSYIYFITPVASDPEYTSKREVLAQLSVDTNVDFFFPLERRASFSLETMRSDLRGASLVIADLSHSRPSCYFELGVAQALDVMVYAVAEEGTTLHQTATRENVLFYRSLGEYSAIIRQAIDGCFSVPPIARLVSSK